ncbi:hypothetical protein [Pedobacter sp. ASV28]|uniref:hypothetical protein n=1 Tax=Pedobacter sp. ASV28 TaxID=2795123 RepID=UPI0018EA5864|nr:hypothetical protein [Pedobacter sp. ASV28]
MCKRDFNDKQHDLVDKQPGNTIDASIVSFIYHTWVSGYLNGSLFDNVLISPF